jgi:FkbM family methyltransferase
METLLATLRNSPLNGVLKRVGRSLPLPALRLLPSAFINDTAFSGHKCLDLPGSRKILMRPHWSVLSLGTEGFSSKGGETIRTFLHLLKGTKTFLDIGANIGIYSLLAGKAGVTRILAFEPVPRIFEELQYNLRINGLKRVRCYQTAVADVEGIAPLYVPASDVPVESSLRSDHRANTSTVKVQTITLDRLDALRHPSVDLIKIDTEGTEPDVLAGARSILKRDEPVIICEVLSGLIEQHLHAVLDPFGYRYFWITDKGLVRKQTIEGDKTYTNLNYVFATDRRLAMLE